MESEHEGKRIGTIFRESIQKGMDEAQHKRERKAEAKRIAAERSLAQTEHRLREILAAIAAGDDTATHRDDLATEIEVWMSTYGDWREAGR